MNQAHAHARIQEIIDGDDVVLFMKGVKNFPQCGFSQRVASILHYMKVDFTAVNVLDDDAIREGVKSFSDWPTIPQLYVKKEFVGGCDIITEMTLSGELETLLAQKSVDFDKAAVEEIRKQNA
jgi:monothiol glutaredoxin